MDDFPAFNRLKTCRYGQMLYNINDMYIGRSLELYGEWSEGEVELFRQILKPGDFAIDVGANIGVHTLFMARHVGPKGFILAMEPQRIVYQTLCANMALNSVPNVMCLPDAAGAREGFVKVPPLDYTKEQNFGGLGLGGYERGETVRVLPLDAINLPRCHFIKIDVEGMEEDVLRGAATLIQRHQPILYVENDQPEKSDSLVRYIDSLDYHMYWHRPRLFNPGNYAGNPQDEFQHVVSINMLCVSKRTAQQVDGFERVEVPPPAAANST